MKPILSISTLCLSLLLVATISSAMPLDLSPSAGFVVLPPGASSDVIVSGNSVTFYEDIAYFDIYLLNGSFDVGPGNTFLSFDYTLDTGSAGSGALDYLVIKVDDVYFFVRGPGSESGTESIFLATGPQTISLAFGLESDINDEYFDSIATISNLETSAAPIPEPGTLILLGSGLGGLIGIGRKKITRFFN